MGDTESQEEEELESNDLILNFVFTYYKLVGKRQME
jgi:hypothetical protein